MITKNSCNIVLHIVIKSLQGSVKSSAAKTEIAKQLHLGYAVSDVEEKRRIDLKDSISFLPNPEDYKEEAKQT